VRCPGQDLRYWKQDAIFEVLCPECGEQVEFFKDDTKRRCPKCKKVLVNPRMDFGCALYCQYAELCLGELPKEVVVERANLLKERLIHEVERRLPWAIFQEVRKYAGELEEKAKAKGASPGLRLLVLYFYFLSEEQRREVVEDIRLPQTVLEEVRLRIGELKEGLRPEEVFKSLAQEG